MGQQWRYVVAVIYVALCFFVRLHANQPATRQFHIAGACVGELGFNFVRDYYYGFNSSFYGSNGIISKQWWHKK